MTGEAVPHVPKVATTPALTGNAVVIMGVSGGGKTTVGAALAQRLRIRHLDADNYHP